MFCRNCGSEMNENAAFCVSCGAANGTSANFCPNCGNPTSPMAAVCVKCGVALIKQTSQNKTVEKKSKSLAGVLAIFLGFFGAHEFYLGNNQKAIPRLIISIVAFIMNKVFSSFAASLSGLSFLGTIGLLVLIAMAILNICDGIKIFKGKVTDANGNGLE